MESWIQFVAVLQFAEAEEELSEVQYDPVNAEDKSSEGAALVELEDEDNTKDGDDGAPESPPAQTVAVNGDFLLDECGIVVEW